MQIAVYHRDILGDISYICPFNKSNQIMKKLLLLLLVIILGSCKKEDNTNRGRLDFSFSSIYEVNEIKIGVFQGWVDAGSTDLEEGSTNFYAVHRSQDSKFTIQLDPGPYTVVAYYKDFNRVYNEKIDLKSGNNPVSLNYNNYLTPEIKMNSIAYSTSDDAYLSYVSGGINKLLLLGGENEFGITTILKINGSPVQASNQIYSGRYNFKIPNLKNGENTVDGIIKFKNGEERTLTAKLFAFDKNSVENIWEIVTENYLEQGIFRTSHYSIEKDTIVGNSTLYKNTIIKGLYGDYKFNFKDGTLNTIEVIHGNIAMEPNLNFEPIKAKLDKVFGQPIEISERNYNYTVNNYRINLSVDRSTNILSVITKR